MTLVDRLSVTELTKQPTRRSFALPQPIIHQGMKVFMNDIGRPIF